MSDDCPLCWQPLEAGQMWLRRPDGSIVHFACTGRDLARIFGSHPIIDEDDWEPEEATS